jgi:hypothetical protein
MAVMGALAVSALVPATSWAQWGTIAMPGTPRQANGTPDLTAPAPRTADGMPDLSGVWIRALGGEARFADLGGAVTGRPTSPAEAIYNLGSGVTVLLTPAAEAIYTARTDTLSKDMPSGRCLPHGPTKALSVPEPFKIVQTPAITLILHEEFNNYRQVFTGDRVVPRRTRTWFGHSVGQWADDTLVVHTDQFIDDMWIDIAGHPATEALQMTERIRRIDFGHLEWQVTIDDPGAYVKPWTFVLRFNLLPDTELMESICESERDFLHMVGK